MWNLIYLAIFCFALIVSLFLTPLCRKLAVKFSVLDHPAERKLHLQAKPLLGGAAIYLSFVMAIVLHLSAVVLLRSNPQLANSLPEIVTGMLNGITVVKSKLLAILLGGTIIFSLGLWDDFKGGINPYIKLAVQILVSLLLIFMGIRVTIFLPFWLSVIITLIWMVGITNAFNLLDNMDGLSSGVALIATLIFFLVAWQQGQFFVSAILIVFAGSLAGFLPYNFRPATIFMGDAGSLFVGFLLAVLTVLNTFYTGSSLTYLTVIMPLLILGVPIFDTISVIFIRLKEGRSIFTADKKHFSHRLVRLGMSQKQAVVFVYLVTFCTGINATLLRAAELKGAMVILIQALVIFGLVVFLEITAGRTNGRQ